MRNTSGRLLLNFERGVPNVIHEGIEYRPMQTRVYMGLAREVGIPLRTLNLKPVIKRRAFQETIEAVYQRMKKFPDSTLLGAHALNALLADDKLIPLAWQWKRTHFFGTLYRCCGSNSKHWEDICVRRLHWHEDHPQLGYGHWETDFMHLYSTNGEMQVEWRDGIFDASDYVAVLNNIQPIKDGLRRSGWSGRAACVLRTTNSLP